MWKFIRHFLIIFIILFQVSFEKKIYGVEISGLNVPDEVLREIVEYTPYPLKTIEIFKLVSRSFCLFSYRAFFDLGDQVMDRLCFESTATISNYLSFKESLDLKRMFVIFFNTEDHDRVSEIENFEFIVHPIANEFKQAMLKDLENDPESNFLFKNIIQKLEKPIQCPIEKNFLSICYQHGLGFEKDENEARKLEKKIISDLSSSHQPIFSWNFQIWMEPIFFKWFQGLEFLTRLQLVQDYLKHFSYARVEFVKGWIQFAIKEICEFVPNNPRHFYSYFQIGECYFNLLNQLPLNQFIKDYTGTLTQLRNWLKKISSAFFKLKVKDDKKVDLFLKKIKAYFKILELFKNEESIELLKGEDTIDFLNEIEEFFVKEFMDFFGLQGECFFLGKFKAARLFSILNKNSIALKKLKKYAKNWLASEKNKIKKMLSSDFSKVQDFSEKWKDYYSMAVYCIQEKQDLEEVGMKWIQDFFNSKTEIDFYLQLEAAAEWIDRSPNLQITQYIRDWARSEKVNGNFERWLNQLNQNE